jgi:hypothetical protein
VIIKIKFWLYQHSGVLLVLLVLGTGGLFLALPGPNRTQSVTIVGAVLSLSYFLQKQKLDEIRLFKDMFVEFTRRYTELSESLSDVVLASANAPLDSGQRKLVTKYFNLCAEEFLFYQRGYIHPDAWKAWTRGMFEVFSNPRVASLWDEEEPKGSYYGFEKQVPAIRRGL